MRFVLLLWHLLMSVWLRAADNPTRIDAPVLKHEKSFSEWLAEQWQPLESELNELERETIILSFQLTDQGQIHSLNLGMSSTILAEKLKSYIRNKLVWDPAKYYEEDITCMVYCHIMVGSRPASASFKIEVPAHFGIGKVATFLPVYENDYSWSTYLTIRYVSDPEDLSQVFDQRSAYYSCLIPKITMEEKQCIQKAVKELNSKGVFQQLSDSFRSASIEFLIDQTGKVKSVLLISQDGEAKPLHLENYPSVNCALRISRVQGKSSPMIWSMHL